MSQSRATGHRHSRSPTPELTAPGADARQTGYLRARDLPRLLPLWPRELEVRTAGDHAQLLARLRRALRAERLRGVAGHWAYDLARHAQLLRAYRAETHAYLRTVGRPQQSVMCDGGR